MNINELQQTNSENNQQQIQNVKKYSDGKKDSSEFAYYIDLSKKQNITGSVIQEEKNNEQIDVNSSDTDETINNQAIGYMQTVSALNNEIFDLGIMNSKITRYNFSQIPNYNIDLSNITMNDIKLFEGLAQHKTELAINSFSPQNQSFNLLLSGENIDISYKSIEVSKTLFVALENAAKTGKAVRLDFGKDTSVILKISKDGKLSADFIPNEKAMETVLKNALPLLKAKLEEQNLPYGELNYKQYKQQENNQKQNKEKKDE